MQNYLFKFVFLYFFILTKKHSFLQLNCRYSKANNFFQVVPWPVEDYRRRIHIFQVAQGTDFDILIRNYWLTTNFFSLLRWHLKLFQFSFVNESIFNLFLWIKVNTQKFTLLIEKVTFQEKQHKIWIFFNKIWIL